MNWYPESCFIGSLRQAEVAGWTGGGECMWCVVEKESVSVPKRVTRKIRDMSLDLN